MPQPKREIPSLNWAKTNEALAAEAGVSVWTIIRWRKHVGIPATARKVRSNKGKPSPHSVALGKRMQPVATEAAKKSPKAGRGVENVHAVDWVLVAPGGAEYRVHNLYEFVRTHPHLFAPADVVWKRQGGKRGTGGEYCNATAGFNAIKGGLAKSWKRWRLKVPAG